MLNKITRLKLANMGIDAKGISNDKAAALEWVLDDSRTEEELTKVLDVLRLFVNKQNGGKQ